MGRGSFADLAAQRMASASKRSKSHIGGVSPQALLKATASGLNSNSGKNCSSTSKTYIIKVKHSKSAPFP